MVSKAAERQNKNGGDPGLPDGFTVECRHIVKVKCGGGVGYDVATVLYLFPMGTVGLNAEEVRVHCVLD